MRERLQHKEVTHMAGRGKVAGSWQGKAEGRGREGMFRVSNKLSHVLKRESLMPAYTAQPTSHAQPSRQARQPPFSQSGTGEAL